MERDSRNVSTGSAFGYGAGPSWIDRLEQVMMPQHSILQSQTRMPTTPEGANPLDLTSAIAHEVQRTNSTPQPGWQHAGSHELPQEPTNGLLQQVLPFGAFLSQHPNSSRGVFPQYIPRFDEAMVPAASPHQQIGTRLQDYATESESLASAHQGFFSGRSASANEFPSPQARVDSTMRATCSPWIERMMQADVTPTPCPSLCISTSLSLAQRAAGDVSCVASGAVDLQSCHSSDMQQWSENPSMRSTFSCDPLQRESTVEISVDLGTDDEDLETRPIDEKRKKRMLSNRASAQRSRLRRQERLDHLEVLTAQLRVENSTLQKKLSAVIQVAKKLEDQNTNLQKKVEKLSKELDVGKPKKAMAAAAAACDECASSQQTTCASSCEMIGDRTSGDPALVRDGNGVSTPSMSAGSPGWPSGSRPNGNNREESSPVRRSSSGCRVGKKRSFGESESAGDASVGGSHDTSIGNQMGSGGSPGYLASSQPSRPRPSPAVPTGNNIGGETNSFPEPSAFANSFGLDSTLEADRWLEFAECFK